MRIMSRRSFKHKKHLEFWLSQPTKFQITHIESFDVTPFWNEITVFFILLLQVKRTRQRIRCYRWMYIVIARSHFRHFHTTLLFASRSFFVSFIHHHKLENFPSWRKYQGTNINLTRPRKIVRFFFFCILLKSINNYLKNREEEKTPLTPIEWCAYWVNANKTPKSINKQFQFPLMEINKHKI